jgi:hypothetical protein
MVKAHLRKRWTYWVGAALIVTLQVSGAFTPAPEPLEDIDY